MRVTLPATIAELRAVNVDLRATIVRLEERVRDLETRQDSRRPYLNSAGRTSGWKNGSGISKPGWGSIRGTRPGLRRPTCWMHGLDLFAHLAGACTASMDSLAVPHLFPAPACTGRRRTSHQLRVTNSPPKPGSGAEMAREEASPTAIAGHLPRTGRETRLVQPFPT